MARISGVDIPNEKCVAISLTYLYGIGLATSQKILKDVGINENVRVKNLTDEEVGRIVNEIEKNYTIEGPLKRQVANNIQRLKQINCYRGQRHRKGLPCRGQRTRTNARSRKGPRRTVANKKKATK
jgi:small subunit ribosomal protein S13